MKLFAGVDIGGTGTKIGLFDAERKLLAKSGFVTLDPHSVKFGDPEAFMNGLSREIADAASRLTQETELAGVGIGVPGQIDSERGTVIAATNLGWRNIALAAEMESRLKVPVRIDHDVRTFAQGEAKAGAAKGYRNILCLTIGTGIGASIVIDGKLVRGGHHLAGEIGHASVEGLEMPCPCGKIGCLETVVSAPGLTRLAAQFGLPTLVEGSALTAKDISQLCAEGNPIAIEVYRYAAALLAGKLETAVALLDPEIIVIGGGVADAGEFLFAPLRKAMHKSFPWLRGELRIVQSELGEDAFLYGALYHVFPEKKGDTR